MSWSLRDHRCCWSYTAQPVFFFFHESAMGFVRFLLFVRVGKRVLKVGGGRNDNLERKNVVWCQSEGYISGMEGWNIFRESGNKIIFFSVFWLWLKNSGTVLVCDYFWTISFGISGDFNGKNFLPSSPLCLSTLWENLKTHKSPGKSGFLCPKTALWVMTYGDDKTAK